MTHSRHLSDLVYLAEICRAALDRQQTGCHKDRLARFRERIQRLVILVEEQIGQDADFRKSLRKGRGFGDARQRIIAMRGIPAKAIRFGMTNPTPLPARVGATIITWGIAADEMNPPFDFGSPSLPHTNPFPGLCNMSFFMSSALVCQWAEP